jgi:hypothetical protein
MADVCLLVLPSFRPRPILGAIALDSLFVKVEHASLTSAIAAVIVAGSVWRDGRWIVVVWQIRHGKRHRVFPVNRELAGCSRQEIVNQRGKIVIRNVRICVCNNVVMLK